MGRPIITDKPKPLLGIVEPRTRRRISPEEKETGLGPERVASIPADASPLSAFALHQELFRRLRSIGGRPGLDGGDMNPKIPMRRSSWKKLEQNARRVETTDFHPTPAQLASTSLRRLKTDTRLRGHAMAVPSTYHIVQPAPGEMTGSVAGHNCGWLEPRPLNASAYSTVTDFARFRG
jgi:hypothetical protein